jgi:hypothetical protein
MATTGNDWCERTPVCHALARHDLAAGLSGPSSLLSSWKFNKPKYNGT